MQRLFAAVAALALSSCATASPITDPEALARGGQAYSVRCMGCHEPPTPGAPDRAALAAMSQTYIYSSLTIGRMQLLATDLPDREAREIAAYLSSNP